MKQIIKTVPPTDFIDYCKKPDACFSKLNKKSLKERLLEDQGFICCYCGCRINNDGDTKIEHIKCQKDHEDLALCFDNMLVSCDGGDKDRSNKVKPRHQLHCDANKKDREIQISPLDKEIEDQLVYYEDGTVAGKTEVGDELIHILGLNVGYLINRRKNVIEAYNDFAEDELQKEYDWLEEKHDGKYEPYCFVASQYIRECLLGE